MGTAIVTVSYNTRELTALLLWSLDRILDGENLRPVVVDNGSIDGSVEMLRRARASGLCELVFRERPVSVLWSGPERSRFTGRGSSCH